MPSFFHNIGCYGRRLRELGSCSIIQYWAESGLIWQKEVHIWFTQWSEREKDRYSQRSIISLAGFAGIKISCLTVLRNTFIF